MRKVGKDSTDSSEPAMPNLLAARHRGGGRGEAESSRPRRLGVSQDDFGQRAPLKLNVIPVISALISKPIFGGA